MADTQTLNVDAVSAYLRARLPGFDGPVEAVKFESGQSNPTFLLKTAAGNYVLRRKPPGQLLKSAHAVDREFRVQRALQGSDVPVAAMHVLCEAASVIGSDFYVRDHVAGRIFDEPLMDGATPAERGAVIDDMNRVLAALHSIDVDAVGLSDYGPPGHYLERQVARWSKQYRAAQTEDLADMNRLMDRLAAEMPPDDGQRTLVHGDYRIDNMIYEADGTRCLAVRDWELSTIGHPYADLASVIMQWQLPPGREGRGLAGVDRAALGLPSDGAFLKAYCARRGIDRIENFGYFVAFCFFRMGAIIQGVLKRALDGNASNPERAMQLGAYVPLFASSGLQALG